MVVVYQAFAFMGVVIVSEFLIFNEMVGLNVVFC